MRKLQLEGSVEEKKLEEQKTDDLKNSEIFQEIQILEGLGQN